MNRWYGVILVLAVISMSCLCNPIQMLKQTTIEPPRISADPNLPPDENELEQMIETSMPEVDMDAIPPILFTATGWCVKGSGEEIFLINPDGTGAVCLTKSRGDDRSPAWSPDGKQIVFTSERDGTLEIYIMDADGSNQTRITENGMNEYYPSWSNAGSKIVFKGIESGVENLFLINPDGSGLVNVTRNEDKITYAYPDWSPDDEWIAYSSFGRGKESGIYIIHPDGSEEKHLAAGPLHNPNWSPDGSMIALDGEPGGNKFDIYVMNRDGSDFHIITRPPSVCHFCGKNPVWSPDGSQILITAEIVNEGQNYWELFILNLDGSGERQITKSEPQGLYSNPTEPDWAAP